MEPFYVARGSWKRITGPLRGTRSRKPEAGSPPAHSRFPGLRRLTRDSRNRRLTRDSRIPDFSRKNFWKNRKNRFFGLPGPK